jgi:5-methylcytosine-specific restriction endonuclease McrA
VKIMTDYTIKRFNPYTKEELISALKEFAELKKVKYVAARDFCRWFGISETTVSRHFGKWSSFCREAGLDSRYNRTKNRSVLLANLGKVWETLGRQPRAKEMKQPLSPISCSRYLKEFGNWYQTCLEFISWKSGMSTKDIANESRDTTDIHSPQRKTKRGISLALRYDVLKRDGFRCVICGRSPATESGVVLHIDHIQPWIKGGETKAENLQTLCEKCNLGKSDKT